MVKITLTAKETELLYGVIADALHRKHYTGRSFFMLTDIKTKIALALPSKRGKTQLGINNFIGGDSHG